MPQTLLRKFITVHQPTPIKLIYTTSGVHYTLYCMIVHMKVPVPLLLIASTE